MRRVGSARPAAAGYKFLDVIQRLKDFLKLKLREIFGLG